MCLIIIYMFMYMFACGAQLPTDSRQPRPHRGTSQSHTVQLQGRTVQLTHTRLASPESTHFSGDCHGDWCLAQTKKTHLVWSARATQITKRALKLL